MFIYDYLVFVQYHMYNLCHVLYAVFGLIAQMTDTLQLFMYFLLL